MFSDDLDRVAHSPNQIDAAMDRVQPSLQVRRTLVDHCHNDPGPGRRGGDYSRTSSSIQVQLLEAELAALRRLTDEVSSLEVAFRGASEGL